MATQQPESIVMTRLESDSRMGLPSVLIALDSKKTLTSREKAARADNDGLVEITWWTPSKIETIYVRASEIKAIRSYS